VLEYPATNVSDPNNPLWDSNSDPDVFLEFTHFGTTIITKPYRSTTKENATPPINFSPYFSLFFMESLWHFTLLDDDTDTSSSNLPVPMATFRFVPIEHYDGFPDVVLLESMSSVASIRVYVSWNF
jgi:hypothetical protein